MNSLRKVDLARKINELIVNNKDISVANLLLLLMRSKGRESFPKDPFDLTDAQLMTSIQSLEDELFNRDWRYHPDGEIKDKSLDN